MTSPSRPDGPDPHPDPELATALESWRPPPAQPAFREELRARFLAGEGAQSPAAESAAGRAAPRAIPPAGGGAGLRWFPWAAAAGLAAALLLYFLGPGSGPGSGPGGRQGAGPRAPHGLAWTVLEGSRGDGLSVDGASFSTAEPARLVAALAPGAVLETGAATRLQLKLDRRLVLELGPHSRLTLASLPPQATPGALLLDAERGGLRIVTGPGFEGSSLTVGSPDALVRVVGTEFAVDVDAQGTCVCCTGGTVEVTPLSGGALPAVLGANEMSFAFRAPSHEPMGGKVMPDHAQPITNLRRYWP
jgi:hypothetical protein